MDKLKVSNMFVTGRIALNRKISLEEMNQLVNEFDWRVINEMTPMLHKDFYDVDKDNPPSVLLRVGGAVAITKVTNRKKAEKTYDLILNELNKVCSSILVKL